MTDKDTLIKVAAKLEAHKRGITKAKDKLVARANEQLDSMPETIASVERHVDAGIGGGIFGHRRHLTLLDERKRLQRITAPHPEDDEQS